MENVVKLKERKTARELLKGVKVVDADTHITEWPDLWTSRAPAAFKDRMPQRKVVDGVMRWMMGDYELAKNYGYSSIMKDGSKLPGLEFFDHPLEDVTPGAYDVHERVAYLDREGIAAQVAYTNLLGFGGGKALQVDEVLREMSIQIQNDAMAEMQAISKNRVYPMAMLPWWDVKKAVAEAVRASDMGLRGINIHANPQHHGLPDLATDYWAPLWELCEDRGLPVNFHVGFSQGADGWEVSDVWPSHTGYEKYAVSGAMLFAPNMITMLNLLVSDIFKRHPGLKFTSVESGLGWVPYMLENLQFHWDENMGGREASIFDTFRKHFYVCYWAEREGTLDAVRRVGAENVLFMTDWPHPTCLYPDPIGYHQTTLEQLDPQSAAKIFGQNAEKLYRMDLSQAPAAS
ncbi:amidohydrolase family protein [Novosphingobium bradum]|uniref:Amidohydrolase family protein n=1 Tax=Novosphingobium bradum TaxID=1737444 RepID=A0ABV7IMJ7_9SPHN